MTTSEQISEIATALAKAQGQMAPALKDATNPAFRSKYADLAAVWAACCPALTAHGIAAVQDATLSERGVSVTTRLIHSSGQWMEFGPLTVPMSKQDAHGVGSATTYARRYALSAALGVVADDDDGNGAVGKTNGTAAVGKTNGTAAVQVPAKPIGYDDWLVDFNACADSGLEPLRKMFKDSKPAFRDYLTRHDGANYDKAKAKAEKADKVPA